MQTCIRVWTVIVMMRNEVRMKYVWDRSCCEVGWHAQAQAPAVQHELCEVLQTGAAFRQAESNALQHGHNQTVCAAVCLQARQRRASKYRPWCEHVGVDFRAPACLHAL